jgi:hypothetical protein
LLPHKQEVYALATLGSASNKLSHHISAMEEWEDNETGNRKGL